MPHLLDSLECGAPLPVPDLGDEALVVQRPAPELLLAQPASGEKRLDLLKEGINHSSSVKDISPNVKSSPGIFRESRHGRVLCDISHVTDIASIRRTIEREMVAKGFSRRSLSTAAGLSESAVRDLLTRTDNPGIGTLRKVAEALAMPVDALTGAGLTVPVVGKIGAGGEVLFSLDPEQELYGDVDAVPRPPLVQGRLMALEVVGSSMLPKYEAGEIIYVRAPAGEDYIPGEAIGSYCAVRTADGGTYLKILAKSETKGRFTLRSLNAPDMDGVEVLWASPVLFVMPKRAASNDQ